MATDAEHMRPEDAQDLSRFVTELQVETDRGLALVGGAVIDDKLRATLERFFVDGSSAKLLDSGNGPLGSFSARADACFALGLINKFEYDEITLIRRVRNEFAHGLHGTTFSSEPIPGYCSGLKSDLPQGGNYPTSQPRFRFMNAVIALTMRLYYRPLWVEKERRTSKDWVPPEQIRWREITTEKPPPDGPFLVIGGSQPLAAGQGEEPTDS